MKKFLLMVTLFFSTVLFCGCSTAEMMVKENYDGSIDVYYAIDLKASELVEQGVITKEEDLKMKSTIEAKASELIARSKSEFRYNIAKWHLRGEITDNERKEMFNNLTIYTGWTDNVYAVRFNFKNEKTYKVYADFGEGVRQIVSSEKSFFTTKHSKKVLNTFGRERDIFNGKSAFNYFNDEINAYLEENFDEIRRAKFPEFSMIYSYFSLDTRLHSDADQVLRTSEGNLHSWQINEENSDRLIEFYTISANRVVWYVLALTICFTFTAIYLVVLYFKKDKDIQQ